MHNPKHFKFHSKNTRGSDGEYSLYLCGMGDAASTPCLAVLHQTQSANLLDPTQERGHVHQRLG